MAKFQFNALAAASAVVEEVPVLKENEERRKAIRAAWGEINACMDQLKALKAEIEADQDLKLVARLKRQWWDRQALQDQAFDGAWEEAKGVPELQKQWRECQTAADRHAFEDAVRKQIRLQIDEAFAVEIKEQAEITETLQSKPELAFAQDRYAEIRKERKAISARFEAAKIKLQALGVWRDEKKSQNLEVVPA